MTTKVGPSAVSYGIGVQNRYSAFLDEDDGFGGSTVQLTTTTVKTIPTEKKSPSMKSSAKANGKMSNVKQEFNQKPNPTTNGQKHNAKVEANKRQLQRSAPNDLQASRQNPKKMNQLQNETGSNNKQVRTPTNGVQQHSYNKENHQQDGNTLANSKVGNRSMRDQRSSNNRYKPQNREDGKRTLIGQDGVGSNASFGLSNEDEKRKRQQKRANDMRFKDPEKRESRRNQSNLNNGNDELSLQTAPNQDESNGVDPMRQRSVRNRRDGENGASTNGVGGGRGFRGGRGRRRNDEDANATNGECRADGVQQDGRRPRGDADGPPRRNRNGFGRGSRGERGTRTGGGPMGGKAPERQKPIPNFSDKSDFPSLAS